MRYDMLNEYIDNDKIYCAFNKCVPSIGDEIEIGEVYGCIRGNKYSLYVKKHPRSPRICANEYLEFFISEEKRLYYTYKRTLETAIFTLYTPILMLALVFIGVFMMNNEELLILVPLIVGLLLCNFIKPSALRANLKDALSRIVEISQN